MSKGYYKGWTFKADVLPELVLQQQKTVMVLCLLTKLRSRWQCSVNRYTKKLTSSSVNIKNVSDKLCKLMKIYK